VPQQQAAVKERSAVQGVQMGRLTKFTDGLVVTQQSSHRDAPAQVGLAQRWLHLNYRSERLDCHKVEPLGLLVRPCTQQ
jgi:hypothetical protein